MPLSYNDYRCPNIHPEEECCDCNWKYECNEIGNPYNCEFVESDGTCYLGSPCPYEKLGLCTKYDV